MHHLTSNDITSGDLTVLATKINEFFCSVSNVLVPLPEDNEYSKLQVPYVPSQYTISLEQVEKQMLKTNSRKAKGPDAIPNWIIKDLAGIIANKELCPLSGSQLMWYPCQKKSPPKAMEQDLRPVSLTPVLAKLLEDYPVKWMWQILHGKIDKSQFVSKIFHYSCSDSTNGFII